MPTKYEYRAYREAIAASVRLPRPYTEVSTARPAELDAELERFGPHVVVCGVPGRPDPGHTPVWVELPPEVGRPARVGVGDRRREAPGPTLEGLLGVVDEAEALVRAQAGRAGGQRTTGFIHPIAWKGNSPKFTCRIVHRSLLRAARMASEARHAT